VLYNLDHVKPKAWNLNLGSLASGYGGRDRLSHQIVKQG